MVVFKNIKIILAALLLMCSSSAYLQSGDNCATAINLGALTPTYSGTTTGKANDFNFCTMGSAEDMIFYIDVPASSTLDIRQTTNSYDSRHSLRYSGACPGTIEIVCTDDADTKAESWQNCTGSTQRVYWIQSGYGAADGTFTLTWSLTAGTCPVNPDDCGTSVDLATLTSPYSNTTAGVNNDFTTCGGNAGDHIYYMDVPVGSTFTVQQTSNSFDSEQSLSYGGACPGTSTLFCSDTDLTTFTWQNCTGSTQRVYWINDGWSTGEGTYTFQWSLTGGTCPVPPANDDCSGAYPVTVNPDNSCASTTAGTVVNANQSTQSTASCGGTEDDDVWFSFVATGTTHEIDILNASGSTTNMYHSVWSGACPALSLVAGTCSDANNQTVTGLVAGLTYFIRVYTWTGTAGQTSTFDVCVGTPPPPPANDDCLGAYGLTVNPDYSCASVTAGTVSGATQSSQSTASCGGTEDDDVWFSFVATGSSHTVSILNATGSVTDMYHSVWSGACPALSLVAGTCSDNNNQFVTGLTAGLTYYVRVYTYTATTGQTTTFNVCIGTPPPPPANDECSGAYSVTVNPDYSCSSTTAGTVASATASSQNTASCGGTENDDVWFSFVATGSTHTIDILNASGSSTDMYHSLWSGTCPSLSLVAGTCSDPNNQTITGLTAGTTYYIRVYSYYSDSETTVFDVCVGSPPPPPANDDCAGAVTLTVNADQLCGTTTAGSVGSATASSQNTASCGGTEDDDVWFKFTAVETTHSLSLLNTSGSTIDMYHSVWSGNCPSLTLVAGTCSDGDSQTLTGLTVGVTYHVRVYTYTSTTGQTSSFDVCVGTPTPPPACDPTLDPPNDDCTNATLINTFNGYCGSTLSTYTIDANGAFCGSMDNNSWLQFVASETSVLINWWITGGGTPTCDDGAQFEAYSGSCGSLTAITGSCVNPTGAIGSDGIFSFSGLTIGNTYYIMIDGYAGDNCNYTWQAASGILPIDMINFEGEALQYENDIQWTTMTETNNELFEIEKSIDGEKFVTIGSILGAGNSSSQIDYSFQDIDISDHLSYYRLKQIDFDGKISYSQTILIKRNDVEFEIYPNPTNGNVTFALNGLTHGSNLNLTVSDLTGRIVLNEKLSSNETKLNLVKDLSYLPKGIYSVRIENSNYRSKVQKLVIE